MKRKLKCKKQPPHKPVHEVSIPLAFIEALGWKCGEVLDVKLVDRKIEVKRFVDNASSS